MMPASKFASSAALPVLCSCAVAAALGDASSLELQRLRAANPLAYFGEEGPLARPLGYLPSDCAHGHRSTTSDVHAVLRHTS